MENSHDQVMQNNDDDGGDGDEEEKDDSKEIQTKSLNTPTKDQKATMSSTLMHELYDSKPKQLGLKMKESDQQSQSSIDNCDSQDQDQDESSDNNVSKICSIFMQKHP